MVTGPSLGPHNLSPDGGRRGAGLLIAGLGRVLGGGRGSSAWWGSGATRCHPHRSLGFGRLDLSLDGVELRLELAVGPPSEGVGRTRARGRSRGIGVRVGVPDVSAVWGWMSARIRERSGRVIIREIAPWPAHQPLGGEAGTPPGTWR